MNFLDSIHPTLACSTCIGDPTAATTMATNGAIIAMLLVLGPVLVGFLKFIHYLKKKEQEALALEI